MRINCKAKLQRKREKWLDKNEKKKDKIMNERKNRE
jgi:hypothetical protein